MISPRRLRVVADHVQDTTQPTVLHVHDYEARPSTTTLLAAFMFGIAVGLVPYALDWICK